MPKREKSRDLAASRVLARGEPVAVLSDIHGNLWALDAALRDIDHRGIRDIVHLGDAVYGPLDPRGTAARLIEREIRSVCGNEDRLVVHPEGSNTTIDFVRSELRALHLRWLGELPQSIVRDGLFLCHGTPFDDSTYLLLGVTRAGVQLRSGEEISALVSGTAAPTILCGHDHTPNLVRLRTGTLIVDPGSVGCPAYRDDQPVPHVIECGSPHARYAILRRCAEGWLCEHVAVAYDWDAAAAAAVLNGRPDWAFALATGRVAGSPAA